QASTIPTLTPTKLANRVQIEEKDQYTYLVTSLEGEYESVGSPEREYEPNYIIDSSEEYEPTCVAGSQEEYVSTCVASSPEGEIVSTCVPSSLGENRSIYITSSLEELYRSTYSTTLPIGITKTGLYVANIMCSNFLIEGYINETFLMREDEHAILYSRKRFVSWD
ncbi:3989_t:CDS:2, partial [Scutellospora calospora]